MSVPNGFLAILTLGPAYGSQLQKELLTRAPHRRQLNAGQVYATLERLGRRGLIESAGTTDDGLPLYRLTEAGGTTAREWMRTPAPESADDWSELQDQVLVTASLDPAGARELVSALLSRIGESAVAGSDTPMATATSDSEPEPETQPGSAATLAAIGARLHTESVIEWLHTVRSRLDAQPELLLRARESGRPRRGRRLSSSGPGL